MMQLLGRWFRWSSPVGRNRQRSPRPAGAFTPAPEAPLSAPAWHTAQTESGRDRRSYADRRLRLGGVPGEGALVAVDRSWARGTLQFPPSRQREVRELAALGEPTLYEGILIEEGLVTRIVAQVHIDQVREVFTGVEVEVLFGDVPATQLTVHFRG